MNVPVAVNCLVVPLAIDGFVGVTEIEVKVAAVTGKVVVPEILPDVADIVDEPVLTAAARPVLSIKATPVFEEVHVPCAVKF